LQRDTQRCARVRIDAISHVHDYRNRAVVGRLDHELRVGERGCRRDTADTELELRNLDVLERVNHRDGCFQFHAVEDGDRGGQHQQRDYLHHQSWKWWRCDLGHICDREGPVADWRRRNGYYCRRRCQ
jgi:hypothetical protein